MAMIQCCSRLTCRGWLLELNGFGALTHVIADRYELVSKVESCSRTTAGARWEWTGESADGATTPRRVGCARNRELRRRSNSSSRREGAATIDSETAAPLRCTPGDQLSRSHCRSADFIRGFSGRDLLLVAGVWSANSVRRRRACVRRRHPRSTARV